MAGFWQQDHQQTRKEGLRWSLQLTDRTLAENGSIKLFFQNSMEAAQYRDHPACSIGSDIFINVDKVKDFSSDRGIASLLGLNYHELAHVVYTWHRYHDIHEKMRNAGMQVPACFPEGYNILEEARVESLLAARYPRMEKYFTLILADFIVGSSDPGTFLVVHGRKYLPKKIRDVYRKMYSDYYSEKQTNTAEHLIDEYRTLVYPRDMAKASKIIWKFCQLLPASPTMSGSSPHQGNPVSGSVGSNKNFEDEAAAQKDAEKAKEREGHDDVPDDARGESDESGLSQDSQSGGKGQKGAGDQPGDQDSGGVDGDDSESPQSGRGGGSSRARGTSKGRNRGPKNIGDELYDILEDLADEVLKDSTVQADIQSTRSSMNDVANGLHSSMARHTIRTLPSYPVTDAMRERSGRYAEELRRIWLAMEPGWTYGASEGRLDMNRVFSAATPEELEDSYASWDEGKQHSSKAVGVLVADESSSMGARVVGPDGRNIGPRHTVTAKNIWEIKKACEEVDIELAVITYDSTSRLLYDIDEKVEHGTFAYPCNGGNTRPESAIVEARRILSQTEAPGKFLIVLSDGEWSACEETTESLKSMDDVVKSCGLIGFSPGKPWGYEKMFDIVRRSSGDMFGLMSETVTQIMTRNLEGWN